MNEVVQATSRVPCSLYVSRWPGNYAVSFTEVTQALEMVFCLKESPKPSNFITKVDLRAYGLAPIGGPQVVFIANPSTTVPPPTREVALGVATDLSSCPSATQLILALYLFIFNLVTFYPSFFVLTQLPSLLQQILEYLLLLKELALTIAVRRPLKDKLSKLLGGAKMIPLSSLPKLFAQEAFKIQL